MPVIVIGADTDYGLAVAEAVSRRRGEVRAFVSNPASAQSLRELGIKVAVGDVSDASHIEGAARQAFSAVLVAESGLDDRERSFAPSYEALVEAWARELRDAGVTRIIWVGPDDEPPPAISGSGMESVSIDTRNRSPQEVADEAVRLDDLAEIER